MKLRTVAAALALIFAFGCGEKTVIPVDSQELRDQQDKTQQQADRDEIQYQKEQKKKK